MAAGNPFNIINEGSHGSLQPWAGTFQNSDFLQWKSALNRYWTCVHITLGSSHYLTRLVTGSVGGWSCAHQFRECIRDRPLMILEQARRKSRKKFFDASSPGKNSFCQLFSRKEKFLIPLVAIRNICKSRKMLKNKYSTCPLVAIRNICKSRKMCEKQIQHLSRKENFLIALLQKKFILIALVEEKIFFDCTWWRKYPTQYH